MASASTTPTVHNRSAHRRIAIALAFTGALPTPLPLSWLHKFYLGQYLWGIVYLILAPTLLPQVACCLEGIWYLTQSNERFSERFPNASAFMLTDLASGSAESPLLSQQTASQTSGQAASQTATAIRELEQLRQDGLITEYEFEQKRRKLIDQV
ncbi:MAG: SHOCT domain-containing protein [Phormidesmis sp.]